MTSTIYNVGDKIPLDEIIPGDHIRFECKYTRPQTDTVHLIVETVGLRKRVFCDERNESINLHPDSVTEAYLLEISPERQKIYDAQEAEQKEWDAKYDKAFEAFEALPKGSTFVFESDGHVSLIWTKIKKNLWNEVEVVDDEVYILEIPSDEVFEKVYDEDSGNCYGLLGKNSDKGYLIGPASTSYFNL